MEWRPFAAAFVTNTFKEFVKQHEFKDPPGRYVHRSSSPFSYKPSEQDAALEKLKLVQLRKRVASQRIQIRMRDELISQHKEHQQKLLQDQALKVRLERLNRLHKVRSLAKNKPAPPTVRQSSIYLESNRKGRPRQEDDSTLFGLTSVKVIETAPQTARYLNESKESVNPSYAYGTDSHTNVSLLALSHLEQSQAKVFSNRGKSSRDL